MKFASPSRGEVEMPISRRTLWIGAALAVIAVVVVLVIVYAGGGGGSGGGGGY
jgi:hypothetical protein